MEEWLDTITIREFASVLPRIERLAELGSALRMPASRPLTVFRKQRMNERHEVERARAATRRCLAEGHTAEED